MTSAVKNVLQVNVRLSEGGAAGVARTLSRELANRGIESPMAYGYSTGGKSSPLEAELGAVRITPAAIAAANRIVFPFWGEETPLRGHSSWEDYERAVDRADVVHLHAIHSHIARVDDLLKVIVEAKKPVVWTMHDQWLFTGRCAQPGDCRKWETGCAKCPTLGAYPAARIDRAAVHWPRRRKTISKLRDAVPLTFVACAEWLAREAEIADLGPVETITNSIDEQFWSATRSANQPLQRSDGRLRCLFICRDLRDVNKVHWPTLAAIAALPHIELTVIGDNAPAELPGASILPSSRDRAKLAGLMTSQDALVFLSNVDYFPLTLAEAVTAGLRVHAVDSAAAREFATFDGIRVYANRSLLIEGLRDTGPTQTPLNTGQSEVFAPSRMAAAYVRIYEDLASQRASHE